MKKIFCKANTMDFDFVFMEIKKKWQETLSLGKL